MTILHKQSLGDQGACGDAKLKYTEKETAKRNTREASEKK
jgi:hypothetical protein